MVHYAYDWLSAQDMSFLAFENEDTHMHVAGTQIFEAGPLTDAEGHLDFARVKRNVGAALHLVPRCRQKLQWVPLEGRAVWVDDPSFNLDYHIRHTGLPRPGTLEQLKLLAGRIMSQQLDRSRPLWEMWFVEGLADGRLAMITKLHHCMIDGSSGVDLAFVMMSLTPDYEEPHDVPTYIPRPAPPGSVLLRDALVRRLALPLRAVRGLREFARETADLSDELKTRAQAVGELLGWAVRSASETPLNGELGPHRRFDWLRMPLDAVKRLRRALDCTVNDIVLTIVTGAVRRFMQRRRVRPDELDFRISAPVSVRREEERGELGNRVSSWILRLPLDQEDPREQLRAIHETTRNLKDSHQALGVEMMMAVAEWTPAVLLSLGARAAAGPINMIVTNVPGPQFPLYLLGAKLAESYPQVPLMPGTGLGVALFSYDGSLFWGFNADYELVPDLAAFVDAVQAAFEELCTLTGVELAPQRSSVSAGAEG